MTGAPGTVGGELQPVKLIFLFNMAERLRAGTVLGTERSQSS